MVKILYAVAGEGNGHAIRAHAVIERLRSTHDIRVVAGGAALSFLRRHHTVTAISTYRICYRNTRMRNVATFLHNLTQFPAHLRSLLTLWHTVRTFRPELIITDFEQFSCIIGLLCRIPIVSVDNQHITSRTAMTIPRQKWLDYLKMRLINRFIIPYANTYVVTTFFRPPTTAPVTLVPPILRREVVTIKPTQGSHLLVYQTAPSNSELLDILRASKLPAIVYGYNRSSKEGPLVLKLFSEKAFLRDLATCRAVIANGGFTLLGEALFLKKPIVSLPVGSQFEQAVNAHYLDALGYGRMVERLDLPELSRFLSHLPQFKRNLRKLSFDPNEPFAVIDECIDALTKKGGI